MAKPKIKVQTPGDVPAADAADTGIVEVTTAVDLSTPESREIGQDWANKTSAEAAAAGVKFRTMCRDGWYVPG